MTPQITSREAQEVIEYFGDKKGIKLADSITAEDFMAQDETKDIWLDRIIELRPDVDAQKLVNLWKKSPVAELFKFLHSLIPTK